MNKKNIRWIVIGCMTLFLIPNAFYYFNFNGELSKSPEHWGQYGDFIGGSINPVLTIANIIALIYLTYTVSHLEDKRSIEHMNVQKKIIINQMRHNALLDLLKAVDHYTNLIETTPNKYAVVSTVNNPFDPFEQNTYHLFRDANTDSFKKEYLEKLQSSIYKLKNIGMGEDNIRIKIEADNYRTFQQNFIQALNQYIIKELSPTN